LILEGEQRGGKSSLLAALCPNPEWFLSTAIDVGNKDAFQILNGKWIVEFAEFESMTKGEASKVKAFVTNKIDSYRKSYGRESIDQKRKCVLAATVNPGSGEYFKDPTGGGRWWPVWSNSDIHHRLDIEKLVICRDQLWAEAVGRYKKGEAWHLIDPELIELARAEQEKRRQAHPWEEKIAGYLANKKRRELGVTIHEILEVVCGLTMERVKKTDSMEAANILAALGWSLRGRETVETGERRKVYYPRGSEMLLRRRS
jgi:putative DNA primase/helicase